MEDVITTPRKPYTVGVRPRQDRPIFLSQSTARGNVTLWLDVPLAEGLIVDLKDAIVQVQAVNPSAGS